MIASHCFILFTVVSLVSSRRGKFDTTKKHPCKVKYYRPALSLAERVRTCNDGLSDCRYLDEQDLHTVANFIEHISYDMSDEEKVGFFNIHQGDTPFESVSYDQLEKITPSKEQSINALTSCVAFDRTYNTQQEGLPKIGRRPGQNAVTSIGLDRFYESGKFNSLKKSVKDYLSIKLKGCSNNGLARSRRHMRPDSEASGDFALPRSKRSRIEFTSEFVVACRKDTDSFRNTYCTQGAIIDYGIASYILSFAENFSRLLERTCPTSTYMN